MSSSEAGTREDGSGHPPEIEMRHSLTDGEGGAATRDTHDDRRGAGALSDSELQPKSPFSYRGSRAQVRNKFSQRPASSPAGFMLHGN